VRETTERLFQPWALALLACGLSIGLVLLFPKERLVEQLTQAQQATPATLAFLENLVITNPQHPHYRFLLASHHLKAGDRVMARSILDPLLRNPEMPNRLEAYLLNLQIAELRFFALPNDSPDYQQARHQIGDILTTLTTDSLDQSHLESLAESAMLTGHATLAQFFYTQLAHTHKPQATKWFAKAAELALSQREYRQAAQLYFSAQAQASFLESQRKFYLKALQTLQAGNLLVEATQEAETHLGVLIADEPTLLFLVTLGRTANNLSFSEHYVRKLLHLTQRAPSHIQGARHVAVSYHPASFEWRIPSGPVRTPSTLGLFIRTRDETRHPTPASSHSQGIRPFHDHIYSLAYEVFLENRNLSEAFRIAHHAVQQVPTHLTWRRHLAQVAQWSGKPSIALQQWMYIAQRSKSREALKHIVALAPGLLESNSLIFALETLEEQQQLTDHEFTILRKEYERRGHPEEAVAFLQRQHNQAHTQRSLQHIPPLYERMGESEKALAAYDTLEQTHGLQVSSSLRKAILRYSQGELDQSMTELLAVKHLASDSNQEYWRLLGQLAWTLQRDQEAHEAYRRLWKNQALTPEEYRRLVTILKTIRPDEAVKVGLTGWKHLRQPQFFFDVLDVLIREQQWLRAMSLLQNLKPWEETILSNQERFWRTKAEVNGKSGQIHRAQQTYEQALALFPLSYQTLSAYLWFLIDHNNQPALEHSLARWATDIETHSGLWEVAGAAYQVLHQPRLALGYFTRTFSGHSSDYLWLLNYASVLEEVRETDKAWAVRKDAMIRLRKKFALSDTPPIATDMLQALVRLSKEEYPGDVFLNVLRTVASSVPSHIFQELLVAWNLSTEETEVVRVWFWKQYAKQLTLPAWSSLAMALSRNDWVAIDSLLTNSSSALTVQDRVTANMHLHRDSQVQEDAFFALTAFPQNDGLYNQFQEAALRQADIYATTIRLISRDPLANMDFQTSLFIQLERGFVRPESLVRWQRSSDTGKLIGVPSVDHRSGLSLGLHLPTGLVEFQGYFREALASLVALKLKYDHSWSHHLSTQVAIGRNQEADDSVSLLVGGVKDSLKTQAVFQLTKRQSLSVGVEGAQFFSQQRDRLGEGIRLEGMVEHWVRSEYPTMALRFMGTMQRYSRESTVPATLLPLIPSTLTPSMAFFIPDSFEEISTTLSVGKADKDAYSRALTFFGSGGIAYNTGFGIGYSMEGGLGTRLFGRDRLSLFGSFVRGGVGQNSTTKRIDMQYRRWF